MRSILCLLIVCACMMSVKAQQAVIQGFVQNPDGQAVAEVAVSIPAIGLGTVSKADGAYRLEGIPAGQQVIEFRLLGFTTERRTISLSAGQVLSLDIRLSESPIELEEIRVEGMRDVFNGTARLSDVQGTMLFAGKKSEVILLDQTTANLAVNNPRQVFAKVPGVNVWENDGSGLQTNIAVRGLNPNRSWEFNVRQNGYDISSDVAGYPEAYYMPPAEALQRIELVRGSGALQYGMQMGGLLNYVLKSAPTDRKIAVESRQTRGSFGLFNSFNSVGGTVGKVSYYGYYHHRSAEGWRPANGYHSNTGFASAQWALSTKVRVGVEFSALDYSMQQPAGLTDSLFAANPATSIRSRNWFNVRWYVPAFTLDWQLAEHSKLNVRTFGLVGERNSVGFLGAANQADNGGVRNVLRDRYENAGAEARFLHGYLIGQQRHHLSAGVRAFYGTTARRQGNGTAAANEDYSFTRPDDLENLDYLFYTHNYAVFVENKFQLLRNFSVTPGIRVESIRTEANGFFRSTANGPRIEDRQDRSRQVPLLGLTLAWQPNEWSEVYANAGQMYRPVTFNDMRVTNPTMQVDPNLRDARGENIDLGWRGVWKNWLSFDASLFHLRYLDRWGNISRSAPTGNFDFRTNVANAVSQGLEAVVDVNLFRAFKAKETLGALSVFANYAYIDARYVRTELPALQDKRLELAPSYVLRTGLSYRLKGFSTSVNWSSVGDQFSDAQNTEFTANGTNGRIPRYDVVDFSAEYRYRFYLFAAGVNNVFDSRYFTRRTGGYPGPGLMPAEPRTVFVTLGIKI